MENKNQSLPVVHNQMDKEELKHILGGVEVGTDMESAGLGCLICHSGCITGCVTECRPGCKGGSKESENPKHDTIAPRP